MPGSAAAAAFPPAGCAAAARRRRAARNGSPPAPGPRCHLLGEGGAQPGAPAAVPPAPAVSRHPEAGPSASRHAGEGGRRLAPAGPRRGGGGEGGLEGEGLRGQRHFVTPSRRLRPPSPPLHGHWRAPPAVPRRRHSLLCPPPPAPGKALRPRRSPAGRGCPAVGSGGLSVRPCAAAAAAAGFPEGLSPVFSGTGDAPGQTAGRDGVEPVGPRRAENRQNPGTGLG